MIRWPFALRSDVETRDGVIDYVRAENRELRDAIARANKELRNYKALLADLRTDPATTLRRINAAHHGELPK